MRLETQADCWRALLDGETLQHQNTFYCLQGGFIVDTRTGKRELMTFDAPSHWSIHTPTVIFAEAIQAALSGKRIRRAVDGSKWFKCLNVGKGPFITDDGQCNSLQLTRADIEAQWIVERTA